MARWQRGHNGPVSSFDALCVSEPELLALRTSVREFLVADRAEFGWEPAIDSWLCGADPAWATCTAMW